MRQIDDPLLQDRMHDLDDLANRLLRIVSGQLGTAAQAGLPQDAVLIARNLGPAELLEYDRRKLKGVILEEGSLTAHVTIVARAMGVPMIGRIANVRRLIGEGDLVLVDGSEATAFARPTPAIEEAFDTKLAATQKRRAEYAAVKDKPPVTKDGVRVSVMVNAGLARRRRRAGRDRRRRHRPVPHRIPVPGLGDRCPGARRSSGSTARCSTRPATSRSSSAPSTSAATRACPISTRPSGE